MKPILYADTEKDFQNNGVGVLSDAIACHVERELNGVYELDMQYPVNGIHFLQIQQRSIILAAPDPFSKNKAQPFRVYRITKPMKGIVTVYARHVAYDLMGIPVSPFIAKSANEAMQGLKSNAAIDCPFLFWTDKVTEATMTVSFPKSIWKLLGGSAGSVLDTYGGEYEFDRWNIGLHTQLGENRGVSIRYGKNLTSLEQDENCANCYTGVYPYWISTEGALVQLDEKIVHVEGNFGYTRILDLDLSMEWEEAPTQEQLRTRAEKYMKDNDIGVPEISWTIGFLQLSQTEEYKDKALLEQIELGDTVSVIFVKMGIDVSARAVKTRYNVLLDRYESVSLGRVKANIADTIAKQQQALENIPDSKQLLAAAANATNWIVNGKGYMVAVKDEYGNWKEMVSLDTPDLDTAVNVWRWNNGGFGHSKNGYDGPYETAITQDGQIVATFITAGSLTASIIKAGVLKSLDNETFYLDLENGVLKMKATELSIEGRTVDEIAKEKADAAEDNAVGQAIDIAKSAVDSQTQEDVFNKLTNNGKLPGLFMKDGQLYINASYLLSGTLDAALINVKNLIADKVNSIKGESKMEITESELGMAYKNITNLYIYQDFGYEGGEDNQDGVATQAIPLVYLRNLFPNAETGIWEVKDETVLSGWHLLMGAKPDAPLFVLQCYDGASHIEKLDKLLGKSIAWKYNSMLGGYVLTGT